MNDDRQSRGPAEAGPATVRPAVGVAGEAPSRLVGAEVGAGGSRPAGNAPRRPPPPPRPRSFLWRVFGWSLGVFAAGAVAVDLYGFLAGMFSRGVAFGAAFTPAAALVLLSGGAILFRETRGFGREMRALREVDAERRRAAELMAGEGYGGGLALAARIVEPLGGRPEMAAAVERFRGAASSAHTDAQVLVLLADTVVRPLDRRAYAIVSRAARDSGLGVALSPFGLLDAGLVVWRTLRMVRDVAVVYGFRPGFFVRAALVRRVLSLAATAGAGDFVADAVLAQFGARLGGLLSARAGEGLLTGIRTVRLGLLAMEACRPLPFTEGDRASVGRLTTEVAASIGKRDDA